MPPSGTATATSGSGLAKFGCGRCRQHHLKCDRVTPTCGRCLNADEPCLPPGLKIRETNKHKFKFAKKQKWVKTPRRLVFIDESQATIIDASSPDSGLDEFETAWGSPTVTSEVSPNKTPPMSAGIAPFRPASPPDRLRLMMISSVVNPPSPSWPLTNPEEARLFRHFVEKLAIWLDLCDPYHTFEIIVPQMARDFPVLLKAIFALSARHLGQTHNDDSLKKRYNQLADTHNEACINIMKDLLMSKNYQPVWTEHLFAATIILQVMEEMNAGLRDEDDETDVDEAQEAVKRGHLPGMYRFVRERSFEPGTLGAASFWVGLRQEIYSAVTKRQPVCLNLVHPDLVHRSLDEPETDDYTWANMAVVHCADVVNFCIEPEKHELQSWDELDKWNRRWSEKQPPSYDPVFREPQGSAVFPEIWYHRSCQVIGVQHHRLATLFLLEHRLKPGDSVKADERDEVEERIRETVREICAIGRGNNFTPPGVFTACMAISAFGHYFDRVEEQDAMLAILEQTQKDHARPTESVSLEMLQAWGRHIGVPRSLGRMPHMSNGNA
ncbi:hypothetical protein C8A01DRAFT_47573 [Parachaetomium inaequale]|uniref:Zn(2)-C6 fungal-type domain-containing protein n=1 Tax=Parachaetomium inaequale TaxID=2588326 RepID=A0AAN6SQT3_9PEZI|nr:hypothetical protein C8A01DRAFT_47573 [Parachaetomium inaequale]